MESYVLRIFRGEPGRQYWEEFLLPRKSHANVISSLMEIQRNPINRQGVRVAPVVWESGCLEEVCGSCSMLINGRPRQACSAIVETIIAETGSPTITLAPFTKFPLVRDLIVDRSSMFENLKKVSAWIEVDSSQGSGFGPRIAPEKQEIMYALSTCMTCGCCVEACPQVNKRSEFMGPQIVAQVRFFNTHPIGTFESTKRNEVMMQEAGVMGCGNAQNCVRVCPKRIPLTDALAGAFRDATLQALRILFNLPERRS